MNSKELFALALGIESPWIISEIQLIEASSGSVGELNIYLDFERGSRFKDDLGESNPVYDTSEQRWQHLNFFQYNCYIQARVPRTINKANEVKTVKVPWARSGSGFTLLFEAFSMLLIESEMPVNKVAKLLRVVPNRIWRVFDYWIKKAISADRLESVTQIGIDETSSKKGHKYVTIIADLETNRTIHVSQGKDANTVAEFVTALESKGGNKDCIHTVSMDMSPAFIAGSTTHFPEAQIVFDKFHLVKMLNESMDDVRKLERKGNEMLKGHKYTFLRTYEQLSGKKKDELHLLLASYPTLGEAYQLKELFKDIWQIPDPEEAKGYLLFWCDMVIDKGIASFCKFVNMIKAHWSGIVAYFDKKVSNGVLESINAKVQLAKKRARGYRNIYNFINMIYFITAKLKFDYPLLY